MRISLLLGLLFACSRPVEADFISVVLDDNPVGFWILNDATTTAVDSSVNGFDGTFETGVTLQGIAGPSWVPSSGLVADFNGGTVSFETPLDLGPNGYSIQAWIFPSLESFTLETTRFVASGNGGDGYAFGTAEGGGLVFTTFAQKDYFTTSVTLRPNQWQYVGVVLDENNDAHFYLNGSLVESVAGIQTTHPTSRNFTIGDQSPGLGYNDEHFPGGLAGISVYNRALTQSEIQAQFNAAAIPEPASTLVVSGLATLSAACVLRQRRKKSSDSVPR